MGNYELNKQQMGQAGDDLSRMFVNLGVTNLQLTRIAWLLSDNSPTTQALKTRLNNYTKKLGREAVNISYLYGYNKKITSETTMAEMKAYMEMKGYSEIMRETLHRIAGSLGNLSAGSLDGLKELVDKATNIYKNINKKIVESTTKKGNWKVDGAYKQGDYTYHNGDTYLHGDYKVAAYEANASYSASIFKTDKDGNLVLDPKFTAAAGASFTAFTANAVASIGNDMLGAGAEGHITAGKVGAEVGLSTGLFDKDGNLSPNAHLNASAEAILVDASAEARVTALGVDTKAKASVNVGLGAHANVDIGDGKISADLGASIGLGVSLSIEIDYGKAVNAIKGFSSGIYNSVQKGISSGVRSYLKRRFS